MAQISYITLHVQSVYSFLYSAMFLCWNEDNIIVATTKRLHDSELFMK